MRQIAAPTDVRALSTLPSVDYEDAFLVETRVERSGEEWARATLEGAPRDTRRALRCGWSALGLRLGSTRDERLVLGWQVRRSTPDVALLGADSPLGLRGEVLFRSEPHALLFATFVQLRNPIARTIWAPVAPRHRHVVRSLLQRVTATHA
jgi:hypothetical protein